MRAFEQAGALSFVVITVLLFAVLRRVRDVLFTVTPLLLTGLLTIGTAVAIRLDLNFANVIALPLLFGIGVAFNIYFVMAWRNGQKNLLGVQPDAGGDLQRRDHRVGFRQPVALQPSGHRQHGRALDDLAGLDAGDDAVLSCRP